MLGILRVMSWVPHTTLSWRKHGVSQGQGQTSASAKAMEDDGAAAGLPLCRGRGEG